MFKNQNQDKNLTQRLISEAAHNKCPIECSGLSGSERSYLVSKIYQQLKGPVTVVLSSVEECEIVATDLKYFLPSDCPIIHFPVYNVMPFTFMPYHNETAASRIQSLYQMVAWEKAPVIVTTVNALLQKLIPREALSRYAELIMVDEELDRDCFIEKLISGGYVRSMIVEESGDFCVRGGILDILSPLYPDPLRIEFLGDTVESIRFFSAENQRTKQQVQEAVILPAREAILEKADMARILSRIRAQAAEQELPITSLRNIVDRIRAEGIFPGIESLISLIYQGLDTLFDYIPEQCQMILIEPDKLEKTARAFRETIEKNIISVKEKKDRICIDPDELYLDWNEVSRCLSRYNPIAFTALPLVSGERTRRPECLQVPFSVSDNSLLTTELTIHKEKENLFLPLAAQIRNQQHSGWHTLLVCNSRTQAERMKSLIMPYGIEPDLIDGFQRPAHSKSSVSISLGVISTGFVWPDEALAIITEDEIFGVRHRRRRPSRRKIQTELLSFNELKTDDLVVHTEHGIGRYKGLVKLALNGTANDFLLLVYKDDDKLYLPVDHMNMVQKYMGVEGIEPLLDKMGGKSWDRVKQKVKKSVEKIAGELLKLYAARKVKQGHSFSKMDSYFREFEAGFPYEETDDQLKAIDDVLRDMESSNSMDRLICGDVGYGKTEVALRASFMAVNGGKQVAVLVPTTVLAEQHFSTFQERYKHYPVTVECLSRFRTPEQQRRIIENLKTGKTDVIIGTHRLLQKGIEFKDLGLLVIDEEQRFGVRHKEKLKQIRHTVDVLALSATPIPRTLHMSLMGVRDISIISTPPEQRQSIITYISEFDDALIKEAVGKELKRNGQMFFVHNNINTIGSMADYVQQLVPELRIGVAHGRLDEKELEQVMLQFVHREIDMLLCTTIIESGLDIPSANTIIVNRADRFGLAQMYQLRGRVGRSDEQAYAYLFVPRDTALTRDAQKRLKVLIEHSDLGSGFQIAMNDMRIRGGGTILGSSQSGRIAAVGYDMFLKLMEEAVSELKGEPVQEELEPEINLTISGFFPETYMPDIDQRLSNYRRLARMRDLKEISDFREEIKDRFGELPEEANNLLLKIMLKVLCIKAGVRRLDMNENLLSLSFSDIHQKNPFGIIDMLGTDQRRYEFTPDYVLKARLFKRTPLGQLAEVKNILKEIMQRVNA